MPSSKLKMAIGSIPDWYAVVELDPRDASQLHGQPDPVGEPEIVQGLGDGLRSRGAPPADLEVPEVAGVHEQVCAEEVTEAPGARPKQLQNM